MSTARWARKRSTRVGDHGVFEVWQHHYERDGLPTKRPLHTLQTVDWCNVVPITTDDRIVLVRLHRFGTDRTSLEIPGGLVDPGESPLSAAGRELLEETGYQAGEIVSLGSVLANPALQPT